MTLKFCANLSFMFQETKSLVERYKMAKDAGFNAVECAFPYKYSLSEIVQAKTDAKVEQILLNVPGEYGSAAIPGREEDFWQHISEAITYARELDCKRIHIMSGLVDKETEDHMTTYKKNLTRATEALEKNNIIGVIEPINNYSVPNYFLNSFQKALSVIRDINSPFLRLQLDLFHLQQICGNLSRNIQELFPYIGHMQIAQVPSRHEPDSPGEIDYKYVFSLLEKLGYDGWIGLEYTPKDGTVPGLKWIKDLGYKL